MSDNPIANGVAILADEIHTYNGGSITPAVAQEVKLGTGANGEWLSFDLATLATANGQVLLHTDLTAVLAALSTDPASQTTLAAILAKLTGDPATGSALAAILAKLPADPTTGTAQTSHGAKLDTLHADLAGGVRTVPAVPGDLVGTLTDGRKTAPTPGTAVSLRSTALPCKWVCVTALRTNTDLVGVGGSNVIAAVGSETGQPLGAGESITLPVDDAAKVFVVSRVASEGVSFTAGS